MKLTNIAFFVFLILFIFFIPVCSPDYAVSVVPGWHTPVLAPLAVIDIFVMICLLLNVVAYRKLTRKKVILTWWVLALHLLFILPAVLFLKFPQLVWHIEVNEPGDLDRMVEIVASLSYIAYGMFLAGQVFFWGWFFTVKKEIGK